MKVIIVGLGVQGYKRRAHARSDFVASVDPKNSEADYRDLRDVPLGHYDAVLACIPDKPKAALLRYCLSNGKHVLVEKPLLVENDAQIIELQDLARKNGLVCYTAYNHRFEPSFMRMRKLIESGELGALYSCRMFYGNGTARLVRNSEWRDQGAGVLPDLGSHLLDTCSFWFGADLGNFQLTSARRFENSAPDHVVISAEKNCPRMELEMTLCMWRNHFTCDILAEYGTAHIGSLCKWGPSIFTHRKRVLPAAHPIESQTTFLESDPTWEREYVFFRNLVSAGHTTDLSHDISLQSNLRRLSAAALL